MSDAVKVSFKTGEEPEGWHVAIHSRSAVPWDGGFWTVDVSFQFDGDDTVSFLLERASGSDEPTEATPAP